ncbi:short-chain dehydrogenase/reductase SDR [Piromyces finnis]|uniref:Short-chain dehydrogenase/reductase SDR n=1 Tax=Piromyces finnis TaxID=1754191 RepID=A0A1Y1UUU1_9FUNG|nr:short-chain dehydrogenase/reductase SDR [Piromyces finnis]|eukprot:ORX41795.1 short-chain dehydrogenase/reductase SDR [Piromyces finnis]
MKSVVITGGTRGLGYELAKQFRNKDYNVVICGTKDETVNKAIESLSNESGKGLITGKKCNVSQLKEVEALANFAKEKCGSIDIWINNAGVNQSHKYAWELDEKEIDSLLNIDLKGTINVTNVAMRNMIEQNYGAIYNVEGHGSNDSFQSFLSLYGTAKRAVTYYTDAVANEIKEKNLPIIICKLSPGIMITDFLTSANGQSHQIELSEKTKKVFNILGDYPDEIAAFLVQGIENNKVNGKRIAWLTGFKIATRFMTAGLNKRDFFK